MKITIVNTTWGRTLSAAMALPLSLYPDEQAMLYSPLPVLQPVCTLHIVSSEGFAPGIVPMHDYRTELKDSA